MLAAKLLSPAYAAVMLCPPTLKPEVLKVAVPELSATVPKVVVPSLIVTLPDGVSAEGELGLTTTVKVSGWSKTGEVREGEIVVVVAAFAPRFSFAANAS